MRKPTPTARAVHSRPTPLAPAAGANGNEPSPRAKSARVEQNVSSRRDATKGHVQQGATQQGEAVAGIAAAGDAEAAGLALVLRIEQLSRGARDLKELHHLIANETRKINRARQIFVVEITKGKPARVAAVTGVSQPDQRSVLISGVLEIVTAFGRERGLATAADFTLPAYADPDGEIATAYPFREVSWVPLLDRRDDVFAGLVCSRETPWSKDEVALASRLASTYAHAWRELSTAPHFNPPARITRWKLAASIAAIVTLALPVPITALAPAEIVASDPLVIAAPIDGVIDSIPVEPSARVGVGDVLVRLNDTALRNRAEVASRDVAVAQAKVKQATILAFADARGRHELGLAQAELELKRADLKLATDLLERAVVRATRAGLAVYADRRQLIGRPVATGERIMEIADPAAVEVRVDLGLSDAIALKSDSHVKVFLDVEPLRPLEAQVYRSDYLARPSDSDVLSFRTFARLDGRETPRIGLRGTAQVWGDSAPLLIVLLRRPISAARQWLGL